MHRPTDCCSCRTPIPTPASARPTLRVCRPAWPPHARKAPQPSGASPMCGGDGRSYRPPRGRGSPGSQRHRRRRTVMPSRSHRDGFARPQRLGHNGIDKVQLEHGHSMLVEARKVLDDAGRPYRTHVLLGEPATDIVRVARSGRPPRSSIWPIHRSRSSSDRRERPAHPRSGRWGIERSAPLAASPPRPRDVWALSILIRCIGPGHSGTADQQAGETPPPFRGDSFEHVRRAHHTRPHQGVIATLSTPSRW